MGVWFGYRDKNNTYVRTFDSALPYLELRRWIWEIIHWCLFQRVYKQTKEGRRTSPLKILNLKLFNLLRPCGPYIDCTIIALSFQLPIQSIIPSNRFRCRPHLLQPPHFLRCVRHRLFLLSWWHECNELEIMSQSIIIFKIINVHDFYYGHFNRYLSLDSSPEWIALIDFNALWMPINCGELKSIGASRLQSLLLLPVYVSAGR